ncbi:hypothetical protein [Mesomycoplasma lagogenitalium]|uniref:Lipoprotein n=1 Tax=Mesomycoplasma lagogenitalium TaxID=171286 RepID=A0ABY8LUD5_9BACT|nr:hypothetical protein [Mesomycoplasma lagogenitalium]WGI36844.1 hypothetical protein QEG99_00995 [Mesomycoplasma lagogenitalium]
MKKLLKFSLIPASVLGASLFAISCNNENKEEIKTQKGSSVSVKDQIYDSPLKGLGQSVQDVVLSSVNGSGQSVEDVVLSSVNGSGQYVEDVAFNYEKGTSVSVQAEVFEESQIKLEIIGKWKTFLENDEFSTLTTNISTFSNDLTFLQKAYSINSSLFAEAEKSLSMLPFQLPPQLKGYYTAESYKFWIIAQIKSVNSEKEQFENLFNKYYQINEDGVSLKNEINIEDETTRNELARLEYIGVTIYNKQIPLIQYHYEQLSAINNSLNNQNS